MATLVQLCVPNGANGPSRAAALIAPDHDERLLPAPSPNSFTVVEVADRVSCNRSSALIAIASASSSSVGPAEGLGAAATQFASPGSGSFSKVAAAAVKVLGRAPAAGLAATDAQTLAEELLSLPEDNPRKHQVGVGCSPRPASAATWARGWRWPSPPVLPPSLSEPQAGMLQAAQPPTLCH